MCECELCAVVPQSDCTPCLHVATLRACGLEAMECNELLYLRNLHSAYLMPSTVLSTLDIIVTS